MMNNHASNRKCYTNYSQSFSNLHHPNIMSLELKQYSFRKSYFNPPPNLEESYEARNHIGGAEVPLVQVLQSSKRWLLLQSSKLSQNLFAKINSGHITNPYEVLLNVFKGLATLAKIYGYFLVTSKMIWSRNKQIRVWINEDVFSNEVQIPLKEGRQGQKQFVLAFLLMLEKEIKQWQRVKNVFTINEIVKLLEQKSKIRRESLTSMLASKQVLHRPDQSSTSFEPNELRYYSTGIKGCMSMQDIIIKSNLEELHEDMSSSYTIKEETPLGFKKKVDKLLLYDDKDMKNSVYDQFKPHEASQEVRRTKKKFTLTSTSSTLEKFSQKLLVTMGKKFGKPKQIPVSLNTVKNKRQIEPEKERQRHLQKAMHRSEPISIANELQGLFEEDNKHQFQLGIEGNREELEKIAQEIEQVLIW